MFRTMATVAMALLITCSSWAQTGFRSYNSNTTQGVTQQDSPTSPSNFTNNQYGNQFGNRYDNRFDNNVGQQNSGQSTDGQSFNPRSFNGQNGQNFNQRRYNGQQFNGQRSPTSSLSPVADGNSNPDGSVVEGSAGCNNTASGGNGSSNFRYNNNNNNNFNPRRNWQPGYRNRQPRPFFRNFWGR